MRRAPRILGITTLLTAVLAVLALSGLSCGGNDKNPMNPGGGGGADVTITIVGMNGANSFSPSPDTVNVGQTVAWHNGDATTHTATATVGFNTGNISGGSTSAPIMMNTAGTFPYHCSIHPTMTGTLVVVVP